MKRFAVFASLSLFIVALHFEAVSADLTPVDKHGQLSVKGNRMVNQYGDPVQLRGMSYFWSMAGEARDYYNADVVNWLADDWKVSVVRAAMAAVNNWAPDAQGYLDGNKSGDKTNDERTVEVVDAAIERGIYAIIDWHLEATSTNTEKAKEFFEGMARKYTGVPNVIYEIFNEPTTSWGTSTANYWANTIKPYSQTLVNAIRAIDPDNIIIIGTPTWCQSVNVAAADSVVGKNLVYALHFYASTHKDTIRWKADSAMNVHNKAIFASEFGVCAADGNGALNLAEADRWLKFLDTNKVSWANWSISNKAEAASAIKGSASVSGGWTDSDLTESGTYIRNYLRAADAAEPTFVPPIIIPEVDTFTLVYIAGSNGTVVIPPGTVLIPPTGPTVGNPPQVVATKVEEGEDGPNVRAIPDEGYKFVKWSDSDTANPRQDKQVTGDITVTAIFEVEEKDAVRSAERVIPQGQTGGETVVIAPLNILSYEFTAGPNPVSRLQSNAVNFYWQGRAVKGGKLTVYDAVGKRVNRVALSDGSANAPAKRLVGSWGLNDAKGSLSAPGSYLVKGKVAMKDGKKVKVSVVVAVR